MRLALLLLTSAICLLHAADDGGGVQLNDKTYCSATPSPAARAMRRAG